MIFDELKSVLNKIFQDKDLLDKFKKEVSLETIKFLKKSDCNESEKQVQQNCLDLLNISDEELDLVSGGALFESDMFKKISAVALLIMTNFANFSFVNATSDGKKGKLNENCLSQVGKYLNKKDLKNFEVRNQNFKDTLFIRDEKSKNFIFNLPEEIKWKMVIDAKCHNTEKGKMIFDEGYENENTGISASSEPGYLNAMFRAWDFMIGTIGKVKLDAELYEKIHDLAIDNVKSHNKYMKKSFLHEGNNFGLNSGKNSTPNGMKEFALKQSNRLWFDGIESKYIKECYISNFKFNAGDLNGKNKDCAKEFFDKYYEKSKELTEKGYLEGSFLPPNSSLIDKRLELIIRTCQDLDQMHLFTDGNIRTIAFLVMNKMLIENGFNPTCMYEPNSLDCTDIATLIRQVKEGQKYFVQLTQSPSKQSENPQELFKTIVSKERKFFDISPVLSINNEKSKEFILNLPDDLKLKLITDSKNYTGTEKDYLDTMKKAWDFMIQNIDEKKNFEEDTEVLAKTDTEFYEKIHTLAIENIDNDEKNQWRPHDGFEVGKIADFDNLDGLQEFLTQGYSGFVAYHYDDEIAKKIPIKDGKIFSPSFSSYCNMKEFLDNILNRYNKCAQIFNNVNRNKDWRYQAYSEETKEWSHLPDNSTFDDQKLETIARACQLLLRCYFFKVGNTRTIVFLMLNKMLIENGFVPTCIEDADAFIWTDTITLLNQIKQGQRRFVELTKQYNFEF